MSQFWKRFLREGQGLFTRETRPQVWLGAFGKHPGWDDHIDDIGLETDSLLLAKQILYVDGIGGQISSGEWEKLNSTQRLGEFKHIFLWKRGSAFLIGRIWSSRDGKNRTQYPLIVCAHCINIPLDWALSHILRHLEGVERECKSVQLADEVRAVLNAALNQLRRSVVQIDGQFSGDIDPRVFVERLGLYANHEPLYRILYLIRTQLTDHRIGASLRGEQQVGERQLRLPAVVGLVAETLRFWSQFLDFQVGTNIPTLLTLPLQESWLDATCGEPLSGDFYSLRARPEVLPIASNVPCQISDKFRKAHSGLVQGIIS